MSNVAAPIAKTKTDSDLVVLRHHEVASAIAKHQPAVVAQFLRQSSKLQERACARFWSGEGSKNRVILRKCSMSKEDIQQHVMIWTVGYLAYAKEVAVDGRLDSYLQQRFVEMMERLGKTARSCSPAVPGKTEDIKEASMSRSPASEVEMIDWMESRANLPNKQKAAYAAPSARPAILEKLAARPHREAIEKLVTSLAEETEDGRSQTARLVKAMRECRGSDCSICAARTRRPNDAIADLPKGVTLPQVRLLLEQHLDIVTAAIPRRKIPALVRAAIALGLMARSSDGTVSASSWGFALIDSPRGSLEEKILLGHLIRSCKSIFGQVVAPAEGKPTMRPPLVKIRPPTLPKGRISMSDFEREQALRWASSPFRLAALAKHYHSRKQGPEPSGWVEYCKSEPEQPEQLCVVNRIFQEHSGGSMSKKDTKGRYSTPAIRVEQNDRTFYLAAIPVESLFECCFIDRHGDNDKGYQRKLEEPRANKIAAYLAQPGNSIPGNIVLSATSEAGLTYSDDGTLSFELRKDAFGVLDGQHRLWGYHKCEKKLEVPVTIYVELDTAAECRLFIDVNEEQKGVPKALLLQIKSLAGIESARETELRSLFDQFSKHERSPLRDMLHASSRKQGKISRASFDYALGPAQRSDSFCKIPEEKRFSVLLEYVRAFHGALTDKTMMERRYYFAAMFGVFDDVLRATKAKFGSIAKDKIAKAVAEIANVKGPNQTALATAMRAGLSDATISDEDSEGY